MIAEGLLWVVALGVAGVAATRPVTRFARATQRPKVDRAVWVPDDAERQGRSRRRWAAAAAVLGLAEFGLLARVPVPLPAQQAALRQHDNALTRAAARQLQAAERPDAVGDCISLPSSAAGPSMSTADARSLLSGSVGRVPCSTPHDLEVFYTFPIASDADPGAPGNPEDQTCDAHLAGYVGAAAAGSVYYDYASPPDPNQWAAGDHHASCYLFRADQHRMTGSARTS